MVVLSRKLQIGAFDHVCEGWVNTDITPHMLVARVPGLPGLLRWLGIIGPERAQAYRSGAFRSLRHLDVSRRFRFPDGWFEYVYASHVLEHLHPDEAERCLREVHRVLASGGLLRLAVPDLDAVVAAYDPADPDSFLWGIFQGRGRRAKRSARHWWHYNARSLTALLRACGFTEAYACEYRQGRCPDLKGIENRPGSLFMEAVK